MSSPWVKLPHVGQTDHCSPIPEGCSWPSQGVLAVSGCFPGKWKQLICSSTLWSLTGTGGLLATEHREHESPAVIPLERMNPLCQAQHFTPTAFRLPGSVLNSQCRDGVDLLLSRAQRPWIELLNLLAMCPTSHYNKPPWRRIVSEMR